MAILRQLPLKASWRCLDLGAGAGSTAYWLADRCRDGHVVAADIDVRFLDRTRSDNLEVREFDVGRDEFPAGSFDLIHARSLLCHVPTRDTVLVKAAEWLAPGGWLVVGEPYMFAPETSPYPALRRFYRAVDERWAAQGSDMRWARRLPGLMALAGLHQLGVATRPNCMGLSGVHDSFVLASIRQIGDVMVRDGDITQAELDEMLALFDDTTFVDLRSVFITVWGQRPLDRREPVRGSVQLPIMT
ncbi:MAG: methyltransferase domain-containing protein [Kutzneria sp.]|nr:methyltransferase domain-containing protein [Kutzneria sp.]MBV9845775.1 methyltransferase domain-containing protein [Kutzneria sp.]